MAIVKMTYLRHTYTWSDHAISGQKLGWGITASSLPYDRRLLRELEKPASTALPDYRSGIPVEMLSYSPVCGYVKMTAVPVKGGNAGRKNKLVYIYQPEGDPATPAAYLIPGDPWDQEQEGRELEPVTLETPDWDRFSFADTVGDRAAFGRLLEMVYRSLAGDMRQMNLVAPEWRRKEFAQNARKIMFLIHEMLPEQLRHKAGYISFAGEPVRHIPFVFSKQPIGKNIFTIGGQASAASEENVLLKAFFEELAKDYFSDPDAFDLFTERSDELLKSGAGARNRLVRLAFLYFGMPGKEEGIPPLPVIMDQIPELLYWSASDSAYTDVAGRILSEIRKDSEDKDQAEAYIRTLTEGCTKRSMNLTAREIRRIIIESELNEDEIGEILRQLRENSEPLYELVIKRPEPEKAGTTDPDQEKPKDAGMASPVKEKARNTGPGDPHKGKPEGRIPVLIDGADCCRRRNDFPGNDGTGTDYDNDCSNYNLGNTGKDSGLKRKPVRTSLPHTDSGKEDCYSGLAPGPAASEAPVASYESAAGDGKAINSCRSRTKTAEIRAFDDDSDDTVSFVIGTIVQGFMTGCMMYLAAYAVSIGHTKIAPALLGVWVAVMVNYIYILRLKGEWRPLWKIWGICLAEGLIIETAARLMPTQKLRLIFFVILGAVVLLIQLLGIRRIISNNKKAGGNR